jgi:hypothetical protein
MKKINRLLIATLLTFYFGTTYSQTTDSLSVFPNPFVSSTTIHFDLVQSDTITLRVFNLFGQTIRTCFQSTILPSGSYNINFLGDSLQDGVYIVRLDIGSTKSISKKAVKSGSTSIVEDNRVVDKLFVFPNPTNDHITIPINGKKTIIVTDLNGKIVKSLTTDQQIISLLDIAAGQYFVTILTNQNDKSTTQKIQKSE